MFKTRFTLTSKKQLTHDVYELMYSCSEFQEKTMIPGQYVLFQLLPWLNRAYSIASYRDQNFTLIIKRIPDGKWSPLICDAPIGTIFSGMLPLGHFVLQDSSVSKCFIGTGTGFAPLYCMMNGCTKWEAIPANIAFIFGVRELQDVFYSSDIQELGSQFQNFKYITYLSREERDGYVKWYVTDWISLENICNYEEFYLCGSPAMVKNAREKLEAFGIEKENIYWEQF